MALLEIANLSVAYGAIRALHDVSLKIEQGKIVTLIGANGAGKSTTLRAISSLLRGTGTITFDGKSLVGMPTHKTVALGIAHVPEGRGIFPNLTVDENLELGSHARRDRAGIAADREHVFGVFPRLKERIKQTAGTLSGGEQQMLAIGRALLSRPRLLLLDEPSLGLAPQNVQRIFQVVREINKQGTTILLVEQNARMALQVAHYAYVLEVGHIAIEGAAADLAKNNEIQKVYLGMK